MKIDLDAEFQRQQRILLKDQLMLSTEEAATVLGIGKNTFKKLVKANLIVRLELGSKNYYPMWALQEFTKNFAYKQIDLTTMEVKNIENDHDEILKKLRQENETLKGKVEAIKGVLNY